MIETETVSEILDINIILTTLIAQEDIAKMNLLADCSNSLTKKDNNFAYVNIN
jgi:hypothetical protein